MAYNEELEIRTLLERYMDGESTLQEESQLKEYFCRRKDIPADLIYAKAMFVTFNDLSKNKARQHTPFISIEQPEKHRILLSKAMSMAASLLIGILVGGGIALIHEQRQDILAEGKTLVQPNDSIQNEAPIYGYIDGKPITDVHEACYHGAKTLKTMGSQIQRPHHYLCNFD